jgi:hypothetical protein
MSMPGGPYTEEATTRGFGTDEPRGQGYGSGGSGQGWGAPQRGRRRDKPFFLTSEFLTLLAASIAVGLAGLFADSFDAKRVWTLITVVAAAYIVSRGLAKIGRGDGTIDRNG